MVAGHAGAELGAPGGIDDHIVTGGKFHAVGIEKVYFLTGAELNIHNLHLGVGGYSRFLGLDDDFVFH